MLMTYKKEKALKKAAVSDLSLVTGGQRSVQYPHSVKQHLLLC